ncbi:lipopolysaccharide export system protein LptA [Treponema berlinense]|uniref:Lipopolysaccharide export system protein LptA n=1 Tax=Treponema berlinense TaxID=225004 RepID=A0A1T4PV51_9SPIR|nr:LptA/OstA family protein [Treponema berlinense]SJZ94818.1 lipopolysaccharide export system protein LptA [Treponema berlinense]
MKNLISIIFALVPAMIFCEEITFTADFMSGTAGSKTDTTTLEGNATVQTSSMNISADAIELSGEDFRFITATGTVSGSITESQMDFTCGKLKYDRQTKVAQLEDAVHLVDVANEVTADAQIIEYNQNSETAVMQIEITLTQKDNVCTSAFAIYKKSEQKLEMSGNPKIQQGTDSFRAQEITLNLETQEITLDGRVKGTVSDSKPAKTETDTESAESETASQTENPPSESEISSQTENSPSDGESSPQNENSLSESKNSAQNENPSQIKNIQEDSQQTSEKNTKSDSENDPSAKS